MDIIYIDNNHTLAIECDQLQMSPVICVDTEFHRENTYYPELALIQISNGEKTICIDPLSLDNLKPILALLTNPAILKVFHASQQDMEIFHHHFNILPAPVFDTQIAAGLLGYGDQIGYAALIKTVLNVDIDKSQTRTDWMKRPLDRKQIQYAASDVYYLAKAYPKILEQLENLGRLDWLKGDFSELCLPARYTVELHMMWKKVKGHQQLRGFQLALLQALASWREEMAQQRDKPRRRIIPDEALIDIARQKPQDAKSLLALRSMQKTRLSREDAETVLERMSHASRLAKSEWPKLPKKQKLSLSEDALVDCLMALLKLKAEEHHINPSLLASRKHLEALARGERELDIMKGWRFTHAGEILLEFLNNKVSLQADSNKLVASE